MSLLQNQRMGYSVKPLPEDPGAAANIDMLLNGSYWELKTPLAGENAIRKRIDEAVSKWERIQTRGDLSGDFPRVVLDNRYSYLSDKKAYEKFASEVEYYAIKDAIFIGKDGAVKEIN